MSESPVIYFDLGSPYAYLAIERAELVLGSLVEFEPILLGAIFKLRGRGSWAETERRQAGMSEVEERARRYGLPALVWPDRWPGNSLAAGRAATWAKREGAGREFARAVYRRQFAGGADITDLDVLAAAAGDAGLDPAQLGPAIATQEIKDALRRSTEAAWERGVHGVPSIRVGERIFFGDDRLEEAAAALAPD